MIAYSLGERSRRNIIYILAFCAISSFFAAEKYIDIATIWLEDLGIPNLWVQSFMDIFSASAFFVVLGFLFNRYLWRLPVVRNWFLEIPNLNGLWLGTMDRLNHETNVPEEGVPIDIRIKQTFFFMQYTLRNPAKETDSGSTKSSSDVLGIFGDEKSGYLLREVFSFKDRDGKKVYGAAELELENDGDESVLEGSYISSKPRSGTMTVSRVPARATILETDIFKETSLEGEEYLAIHVPSHSARKYERRLLFKLGCKKTKSLIEAREARDGKMHHITIVSPVEFKKMTKANRNNFIGKKIPIAMWDIRVVHSKDRNDVSYRTFGRSTYADYLRRKAGLPPRDLHMTLGFAKKDVHDQRRWELLVKC